MELGRSADLRVGQRAIAIGNRRLLAGGDLIMAINGELAEDWTNYLESLELSTEVGEDVQRTGDFDSTY